MTAIVESRRGLSAVERGVAEALAYADVFDWPLTIPEIQRYLPVAATTAEVEAAVAAAGLAGVVERAGGLVMLRGRRGLAAVRSQRETVSAGLWPRAVGYAQAVGSLPFVRMVAVTGSLAAGSARDVDDVDLFVVTAAGRLWLARAAAMAIVRLARLRGVRLCPNYLVAEPALRLPERSLFAARELAQMVPVVGPDIYERLIAENGWYREFLPNAGPLTVVAAARSPGRVRTLAERLLRTRAGDRLERFEMERKTRRLCAASASSETRYDASCCKGHADEHGRRILAAFERRLALLNEEI